MFLWILLKIHHTYCGIQAYACHWLSTTRGSKGLQKKSITLNVEFQAYACHCRDDACTLGEHSRMSVLFQSSTSLLSEGSGVYLREGGEYEGVIGRRSETASIGSRISNRGSPYSLSESKHSLGSVQSSPKRSTSTVPARTRMVSGVPIR